MEGKYCFSKICYIDSSGAASGLRSLESSLIAKNHPVLSGGR